MKLLLTSGGVTNPSIRAALVEMLGKPIEESTALYIPTAQYGHPMCGPELTLRCIAGPGSMTALGWKSVGLLELTALPSMAGERWKPWVEGADALLVDGGDATYLAHWIRKSGLLDLFPRLAETVWVGISAGSMVMTPRIGPEFVSWDGSETGDRTLGLVDFTIFPHLDYPGFPENTLAHARKWAEGMDGPAYAIDDQTAIRVDGADVDVVSEGHWERLE
ncbi:MULTISPECIES: Type 1 glutamine amidotransferase-like domain-containing protein [unclassified Microbacterium]|uniref:Type 1 glutamine amidotransferase-like domain-containing protein n=1 Tax=unclassified Microbacterium TaxID=2609290 RepID=UPI0012F85F5F|nr:Type 1 glutamine amidotransferase-like domain-containing protein [Microbacterium sp. MAH-37]MVQ41963.1 peptidase E [Microbacterium sp. MAH-37]